MSLLLTEMDFGDVLEKIRTYDPFISIIRFKPTEGLLTNLYKISDYMAIHIKYATGTNDTDEYTFQYSALNIEALEQIGSFPSADLLLALVCADIEKICIVEYRELLDLIEMSESRWKRMLYVDFN